MPNEYSDTAARTTKERPLPRKWRDEMFLLSRMLKRTRVLSKTRSVSVRETAEREKTLRLASITSKITRADGTLSRVQRSLGIGCGFPEVQRESYQLHLVAEDQREALRESFLDDLRAAASAGAQVICVNELGYPNPPGGYENEGFLSQIQEVVDRHGLFLVGGSFHDELSLYNLCPIFSPETKVITQKKLNSAHRVQEKVRRPFDRRLRYYQTPFGNIAILICLDAYEPTLLMRLMYHNSYLAEDVRRRRQTRTGNPRPPQTIDCILVPAYEPLRSPADKQVSGMFQACKDLSYGTGTAVAYVNCWEGEPRQCLFVAGEEMGVEENPLLGYRHQQVSERITLQSVDLKLLREKGTEKRNGYSTLLRFFLGADLDDHAFTTRWKIDR